MTHSGEYLVEWKKKILRRGSNIEFASRTIKKGGMKKIHFEGKWTNQVKKSKK